PRLGVDDPLPATEPLQLDVPVLPPRRRPRAELGRKRPSDLQPQLFRRGFRGRRRAFPARGRDDVRGRLVVERAGADEQGDPSADTEGDRASALQAPSGKLAAASARQPAGLSSGSSSSSSSAASISSSL